jgi:hypothetical protein
VSKRSRRERFEMIEIERSEIRGAAYNPRVMDPTARRKLKENLRRRGLVCPLVWNKRTGNLVAGHQRLGIMDDLEGGRAYRLTVAALDVPPAVEKELNIFLNNPAAQGNFDFALLGEVIGDEDLDLEGLGFDLAELARLCPDVERLEDLLKEESEAARETAQGLDEVKRHRADYKQRMNQADDSEFYCVLVFQDRAQTDAFLAGVGADLNSRYVDGGRVAELCGVELPAVNPEKRKTAPEAPAPGGDTPGEPGGDPPAAKPNPGRRRRGRRKPPADPPA